VRARKAAFRASEKFETGQGWQGLKPEIFSTVYGPTKVVKFQDILYRLSPDILYTFLFF
jgi:hypothetical protein